MKKPSIAAYGLALLVVAVLAVVLPRFRESAAEDSPDGSGVRGPETSSRATGSRMAKPPRSGEGAVAGEAGPDFETDEEGIVDTEAYDSDQDGWPEISTYVSIYRRLKTTAGKYDMLQNARILEPPDDPVVNELIITEAARAEDPEIRQAAREALLEYGGEKARAALADYIATQTGILDVEELKRTLDKTGLMGIPRAGEGN